MGAGADGVLRLPSGRLVRGRGLAESVAGGAAADVRGLPAGQAATAVDWESRWLGGRTSGCRVIGPKRGTVLVERLERAGCRAGRGRVQPVGAGGPVLRWPAWPCSTGYRRLRRWSSCVRTTTRTPWRRFWQKRFVRPVQLVVAEYREPRKQCVLVGRAGSGGADQEVLAGRVPWTSKVW